MSYDKRVSRPHSIACSLLSSQGSDSVRRKTLIFNNNRNKGFSFRAPLIYFFFDCQSINSHASLRGRGRVYVYVTRSGERV